MSISTAGKAVSRRQKFAKLTGETTVEVENHQVQNLNAEQTQQNGEQPAPETLGTLAIAGKRPITTSNLQVIETFNVMGIRPIGANTIQVVSSINLSGIRPIASSSLVISESYSIFGNRPVASNVIDDSESLMGFID